MTRLGDVFQPDPARHAIYEGLYQGVYKKMYARLQPLYEELRAIGSQNKTC
jgi:sugar (pentulose or hexulose) kinase